MAQTSREEIVELKEEIEVRDHVIAELKTKLSKVTEGYKVAQTYG